MLCGLICSHRAGTDINWARPPPRLIAARLSSAAKTFVFISRLNAKYNYGNLREILRRYRDTHIHTNLHVGALVDGVCHWRALYISVQLSKKFHLRELKSQLQTVCTHCLRSVNSTETSAFVCVSYY